MGKAACLLLLFWLVTALNPAWGREINAGDWVYLQDQNYDIDKVRGISSGWQRSHWAGPNLGFTFNPYWFRLTLPANSLASGSWYLWVHNAILTDLRFYLERDGRLMPVDSSLDTRLPAFRFQVNPDSEYRLYLWVNSATALQLPTELVTEQTLLSQRETQDAILGVFLGVLLAMMLYNLVLYIIVRDRNFILYVLHAGALMLFVCSWQGVGAQYLWPGWPGFQDRSVGMSTFAVIAFSMWFCGGFLNIKKDNFKPIRWFWLVRNLGFAGMAITPWVPPHWSIFSASLLSFFAVLMVVRAMIERASLRYRPARLFVMGWSIYVTGALMMGLNKFGLIEVTLASENLLLWGAVADMVLLCIALGDKFHEERNLKLRAQSLAIRAVAREKHAKEQAIASERTAQAALEETAHAQWRYQQLLERRVSDRTLELTRLRQELQHASEHDGLTQLKNRRHFMTQLASAVARSAAGAETFALLMVDIDHFKTINDTYGHLAGDECIRGVARLMQEQLQWAAVSLCRYGGEEFVALVPVRNEAQAQSIADELRARVANCPIACGQDRVLLTISIGVVMVPAATPKPVDRLLQQVDAALYQAKDQGRNCVALATG